jgi:site-specific recombinase XerC
MASVFKAKDAKRYTISYFDENGRRRKKTGMTDKSVTQQLANEIERNVRLRKEGLLDPRDEAFRDQDLKPLTDHLADFERAIIAKRRTTKHASMTVRRADRILKLAKASRISDLSLSKTLDALQVLREKEKRNQETINHHIRAVKAFSRWLWRDKRAREHHLAFLSTSSSAGDRRRVRRALTAEESVRLVQTSASGPDVCGMTGPDRAMLYMIALGTGFRAKELRTLVPERFHLDDDPPNIVVRAAYAKNDQEAIQPIPTVLADRIRPWLAFRAPGKPVFEGMTDRTAEMLRVDLEAAGIPYETSEGVVDFHASRGSYITHLVASGASVKTCQTLARHSTPSLTIGVYAKASLHDIKGAVEELPDLTRDQPDSEALAATGTDGRPNPNAPGNAPYPDTLSFSESSQVEYRRWDSNPHGGYPPEDFKSSASAIPPRRQPECHR